MTTDRRPAWRIRSTNDGRLKLMARVYRRRETADRRCKAMNLEASFNGKGTPYTVVRWHETTGRWWLEDA